MNPFRFGWRRVSRVAAMLPFIAGLAAAGGVLSCTGKEPQIETWNGYEYTDADVRPAADQWSHQQSLQTDATGLSVDDPSQSGRLFGHELTDKERRRRQATLADTMRARADADAQAAREAATRANKELEALQAQGWNQPLPD